jgi:hypothetical protein
MIDPVIRFRPANSNLNLSLYADSRNYVYVQFEFVRDSGEIVPLSDEKLCAEYILDMTELGATAGYWIVKNCVNIKDEDGKHLYFKFREEGDPPPDEMIIPESQPEAPSWLQIGTYTAIFSLLMVQPSYLVLAPFALISVLEIWDYAKTITRKRS